jgi:hypothetical protein
MSARPNLLMILPPGWSRYWNQPLAAADVRVLVDGRDQYALEEIDYVLGLRRFFPWARASTDS